MDQVSGIIIKNEMIAKDIYHLIIESAELITQEPNPGQFLHIRVSEHLEPLLRRPISIHNVNIAEQQVEMIYRAEGKGTTYLTQKKIGEELDLLGPLGTGFAMDTINKGDRVVILGGGIGIPPLYYLAKRLIEQGAKLTILLGYHSKESVFLIDEFLQMGEVRIASMNGTIGVPGTVLELIKDEESWDKFYSCGPTPMLKAIQNKWLSTEIEGYISLEERMGCGIGACYGCVIKVDQSLDPKGYRKICEEGPVFSFREVLL